MRNMKTRRTDAPTPTGAPTRLNRNEPKQRRRRNNWRTDALKEKVNQTRTKHNNNEHEEEAHQRTIPNRRTDAPEQKLKEKLDKVVPVYFLQMLLIMEDAHT